MDATLAVLHTLFLALWLLPVYCVSFALSCVWCVPCSIAGVPPLYKAVRAPSKVLVVCVLTNCAYNC